MTLPILRWENKVKCMNRQARVPRKSVTKWERLCPQLSANKGWVQVQALITVYMSQERNQSLAVAPHCHQGQVSSSKLAGRQASTLGNQEQDMNTFLDTASSRETSTPLASTPSFTSRKEPQTWNSTQNETETGRRFGSMVELLLTCKKPWFNQSLVSEVY